ncbi:MAG: hypothetical protein PHU71_00135 [Candidatus Gracilibacteria bacterium]|nr:hypothetical protein [Candidatus Gracilibacteria bacterium]
MQDQDLQHLEKQLEKRLEQKAKRKRKRMPVSGKKVFELQKLMNKKNG